jgi:branched-chain amino acid transport system substrate-binding protein
LGQVASYDTAIAEAPGSVAEGFYSMSPSLYAYPDDPRPAIKAFTQKYKAKYGVDVNYLGEMGYTSAQIAIEALKRAGHDLTTDSMVKAMESIQDFHDLFGGTYSFSPTNHHGATAAFLSVVKNGRWEPVVDHAIAY